MFTLDTLNKLLSQPEGCKLEFKRTILSMKTKIYLIIARHWQMKVVNILS